MYLNALCDHIYTNIYILYQEYVRISVRTKTHFLAYEAHQDAIQCIVRCTNQNINKSMCAKKNKIFGLQIYTEIKGYGQEKYKGYGLMHLDALYDNPK